MTKAKTKLQIVSTALIFALAGCSRPSPIQSDATAVWQSIPRPNVVAPQQDEGRQSGAQAASDRREAPDYFQSGSGKFVNPDAKQYTVNQGEAGDFSVSFRNMDIKVIAQAILGETLGIPFTIDPRVAGTATLETSGAISSGLENESFRVKAPRDHAPSVLKDHPHFQTCADFCERWDQASFDPDYDSEPLETFEPMVREVFGRKAYDPAVIREGISTGLPELSNKT